MNLPPDQTHSTVPYAPFRPFLHRVLFLVCVVILLWILYQAQQAILLTFGGIILAVALGGLARKLQNATRWADKTWAYQASLGFVSFCTLAVFVVIGALLGPRIVQEVRKLKAQLPDAIENLKDFPVVGHFIENGGTGLPSEEIKELSSEISITLFSVATATFSAVSGFVLVLFIAAFTAAQPEHYRRAIVSMFAPGVREKAGETVDACARALWQWLIGQGIAMLIIAVMTVAGLFLIDMKYALTLGLIAGLSQFVPYIGPVLSTIPALVVAMTISPRMVLYVIGLYIILNFIEGNFVTPIVTKQRVDLPPLITLVATVAFTLVFGVLGAVVATPLAVILFVLYNRVYQHEILGIESNTPDDARQET